MLRVIFLLILLLLNIDFNAFVLNFLNYEFQIEDGLVDPEWTLLFYLRNKLKLCGTKLGCAEGGCGACTVMVSKYDRRANKEVHIPVNACLAPICSVHGMTVTTVEGIGSTKTKLHPVQERIAKAHGSQCGFCTPGIVMSMYTLLRNSPRPSMKELEEAFQGNLCRCTGYRPIIEGYKSFTEDWETIQHNEKLVNGASRMCKMGNQCCKLQNGNLSGFDKTEECEEKLYSSSEFTPYHPSQEPIFPPELKITNKYDQQYLIFRGPNVTWYRPTVLKDLLDLKSKFPNAKIVVGNTEVGVETKFKNLNYPVIIQPTLVEELNEIVETEKGIEFGASVTLLEVQRFLKQVIFNKKEESIRIFQAVVEMLNWFAGKQIRSVGAMGSNIMTGSPISDLIPVLMATRTELKFQSKNKGIRTVLLDENFFIGYRKSVVAPEEVLISIQIAFTSRNQYVLAYKQARRREDDIAIVNAAFNITFEDSTNIIQDIKFGFGGMSFKTVTAPKTETALIGLPWNTDTLEKAYSHLLEDLPLDPSAPGGMVRYRKSLSLSLFFKAFLAISNRLQQHVPFMNIDNRDLSGIRGLGGNNTPKSSQYFSVIPNTQHPYDAVQRPVVHVNSFKQATGEAVYCDDIPAFENQLYIAFVLSTKAHANILSIDTTEADNIPGVYGFVSAKDIEKGREFTGAIIKDERVFYTEKVTSQGQIIGAVVANDQNTAQKATKKVKIEYEELEPVLLTIEDAIRHNSFFGKEQNMHIEKGDIEEVLKDAPHVIEGECRTGGQKHFYLETQCVVVVPENEDDEISIYSSTQNPTEIGHKVSDLLGIPQNKIRVRVKRLGGGFGGKEWKATMIALPVVVAAKKFNRPIRCMLDRDEDMMINGGRHPFLFKYKVGFNEDGKILGLDSKVYNNGGYALENSKLVLERAMTHLQNAYNIPVIRAEGFPCKTNLPSNTAFRGFGGPQSSFSVGCIIDSIATFLKKDSEEISQLNLYKEGDHTYYNQKLTNCTLRQCWDECLWRSNYKERRKEVELFNRKNRYKKRGISIVPTKHGIGITDVFLNQSGALILVYTDGSILLHHGGIEMGQGLYTKMLQIVTRVLEIPIEKIHTSYTSTDVVPNTSETAASLGSDLNGMAVLDACTKIKKRLQPYKEINPNGTWEDWVKKAYFDRVSLSATGFCRTPDIGYDWEKREGNMYNYFTYGAGCSEVEIDTLTGDHKVLRTDIVMDLGESLNPAIDIGQIEGAFIQGYGLFVMEECLYSPTGTLYTRGPGTYKIPGFADIPSEFNVSILKGAANPRAVYSSKAVGEPPLFLAASVFFAIRDAIRAAREENGVTATFNLDAPATPDKIRLACEDNITSKIATPEEGTFTPWNVRV